MIRYYVELGSVIKTSLFDDEYLIAYEEYKYNVGILNTLASRLTDSHADSAIVITHGTLYKGELAESYMAFSLPINGNKYYCNLNKIDVDTMLSLLDRIHVKSVRVVDKFGYYESLSAQDNVIIIDKAADLYLIYVKQDDNRQISYVPSADLEDAIVRTMARTGITNVINAFSEFVKNDRLSVKNLEGVDPDKVQSLLAALSTCCYADSELSSNYELKINSVDVTAAQSTRLELPQEDNISNAQKENATADGFDGLIEYEPDEFDAPSKSEEEFYSNSITGSDSAKNAAGDNCTPSGIGSSQACDAGSGESERITRGSSDDSAIEEQDDISMVNLGERSGTENRKHFPLAPILAFCLAACVCVTVILKIQGDIWGRKSISLRNEIADLKTSRESIESVLAGGGTAVELSDKDASILEKLGAFSVDGYLGEITVNRNSYEVLAYLYNQEDSKSVEESINSYAQVERSEFYGVLDVMDKRLYKFKYTLKR